MTEVIIINKFIKIQNYSEYYFLLNQQKVVYIIALVINNSWICYLALYVG